MRQFYRTLVLFFLAFGWVLRTSFPAVSQVNIDEWVNFIPPNEAIAVAHIVGGNLCNCIKYPPDTEPLTPLIPKLPTRNARDRQSTCGAFSASIASLNKRCRGGDIRLNPYRGGLTDQSFPSFFVYVPKTFAKVGDFLLLEHTDDRNTQEIYHREFSLPTESGIIRLVSPVALEEGKTYEWHFALICDPEDRNGDAVAVGTVKYIELSQRLRNRIDRASLAVKLKLYGEEGLWYDFFALLSEAQQRSHFFREAWEIILKQEFGQDSKIPQAKLLSCCSIVNPEE